MFIYRRLGIIMKQYLLLSVLLCSLPVAAMEMMEIDSSSKRIKEERMIEGAVANPDSLQDLCCKVVGLNIGAVELTNTGIPNFGNIFDYNKEKIFEYAGLNPENFELLLQWAKVNEQSEIQSRLKLAFSNQNVCKAVSMILGSDNETSNASQSLAEKLLLKEE